MEALARVATGELQQTVEEAASGDEAAFGRIVAAYHDDMRRVCRFITRDDALADDATLAAWTIAWRKLDSLREAERLKPWLVSVAANEAKRLARKRRGRAALEVAVDLTEAPGGVDPATGIAEIDLDQALARLGPDDRELIAMRYVAGFDSNELAAATGISPSGTRSRLERLLRRLREDLSDG